MTAEQTGVTQRAAGAGAVRPLAAQLPQISRELARERNAAFAALDGLEPTPGSGLRLAVSFRPGVETRPGLVFATEHGTLVLTPEIVAGRRLAWPARVEVEHTMELVELLSDMEVLVAALEDRLDAALDPVGTASGAQRRFCVSLLDPFGAPQSRVSLSGDAPLFAAWRPRRVPRPVPLASPALRALAHVEIAGPTAPRAELTCLEAGDLVLLPRPTPAWPARLVIADGRTASSGLLSPQPLRFEMTTLVRRSLVNTSPTIAGPAAPARDPVDTPPPAAGAVRPPATAGRMVAEPSLRAPSTSPASLAPGDPRREASSWAAAAEALPVRLQVVCRDLAVSLRELADIGPGCVLDLEAGEILHVELRAEQTAIARGRLVAFGDGYGVLIDEVLAP